MIAYSALAAVYDALTGDVPYEQWAIFAQKAFSKRKKPVKLVLELACGTGSLTRLLGQAGYEMIACDLSADMLAVAREKCGELSCSPVFLCQDMCQLDLYGTIDAAVCCLDSVNYLTELRQLKQAFARVSLFLEPGGLFLFDVKTPLAFEEMGLFAPGSMAMTGKAIGPSIRWMCSFRKKTEPGAGIPSGTSSGPIPVSSWSRPSSRPDCGCAMSMAHLEGSGWENRPGASFLWRKSPDFFAENHHSMEEI